MAVTTTYTKARANFAKLWDQLESDQEIAVIERRGHEPMAMMPASEVSSLLETAHLLRSPKNAMRLLTAIQRALNDEGQVQTLDELKQELGIA
ncbi:type II toxin-antitoxin system Phd/YefM family antitoxin [Acidobacteria bacterium AH-259-A15]|nr:type II toxin-antitoxin system Phd/YefM family antitoxin [Acidobacteria bacterium AH-259-A15]